jgi:PAS domain S-box-containing protein
MKKNFSNRFLLISCFVVFLILSLLLNFFVLRDYSEKLRYSRRKDFEIFVLKKASNFSDIIDYKLSIVSGMALFVENLPDPERDQEMILSYIKKLYQTNSEFLVNVSITTDGVQRWIYPSEGNEKVYGHDLIRDKREKVRMAVWKAVNSGEIVLNGPYELRQGGLGLVARQGIYREGKFWGLACVVLDMEKVLESAGFGADNDGITFLPEASMAIMNEDNRVFWGDQNLFHRSEVFTVDFQVKENIIWHLAAEPDQSWFAEQNRQIGLLRFILFAITFLTVFSLYYFLRDRFLMDELVKQKTAELEIAREDMNNLIKSSPDGLMVVDEEGIIGFCNDEAMAIFELSDYVGVNIGSIEGIVPVKGICLNPIKYIVSSVLDQKKICEIEFNFKKRSSFKWISLKAALVKNFKLGSNSVVCSVRDISERVVSEQNYTNIFNNEHAIMLLVDPENGAIIDANPAALNFYGYSRDEMLNLNIFDLNIMSQNNIKQAMLCALNSQKNIFQFRHRLKNGKIRDVEVSSGKVTLNNRKVLYSLVKDITEQVANSKALAESYDRLKRANSDILEVIANLVEAKDPYTMGHQKRVSLLAVQIAEEMELEKTIIESIRIGSLVHDIGKIGIPSEILAKPSKLNDIEFSLIKSHPEAGYKIIKNTTIATNVPEIVLQHHERIDGSGYPYGLDKESITLEAQIVGVADVIDAICSDRPYRPARTVDIALEEIQSGKGIKYEADIVNACIKVIEKESVGL